VNPITYGSLNIFEDALGILPVHMLALGYGRLRILRKEA
jgi:hypothetical protein